MPRPIAALVLELDRAGGAAAGGRRYPGTVVAPNGAREERQLYLAQRPAARARSRGTAGSPGAGHERRELLRAIRGDRRSGRGSAGGVRRDPRHGGGRRDRGRMPVSAGREPHAGEWGHNPLPWATPRATRSAVLLWKARLRRIVALRPGVRARPHPTDGDTVSGREIVRAAATVMRRHGDPGALPRSTQSRPRIPDQRARPRCRRARAHVGTFLACRRRCPRCCHHVLAVGASSDPVLTAWCTPRTVIRAACEGRRGCGPPAREGSDGGCPDAVSPSSSFPNYDRLLSNPVRPCLSSAGGAMNVASQGRPPLAGGQDIVSAVAEGWCRRSRGRALGRFSLEHQHVRPDGVQCRSPEKWRRR